MSFIAINPDYRQALAGLTSAADFLAVAGTPVCVRTERCVERVTIGGIAAYLKKETNILVRERLMSWWSGFGWSSKSVREGLVLAELAHAHVAAPTLLALGESDGQAFVLLKAEDDFESLDIFAKKHRKHLKRLAPLIGHELARMHEAGFFHPDLFAKHVLIGDKDGLDRVCLIDWQRTRRLPNVPWSRRIMDLAALDASLAEEVVSPRLRLRLLVSYLRKVIGPKPPLANLIDAIAARTKVVLGQRRILRQRIASLQPLTKPPRIRHDWKNCPLRLTEPNLAVLPLLKFLRERADLDWRRRRHVLRRAGATLRELHDAGYRLHPGLESCVVAATVEGDVEILLTSAAEVTPAFAAPADDLAYMIARHATHLSRADRAAVLIGYAGESRDARRSLIRLVRDTLAPTLGTTLAKMTEDVREPAR